MATKHTKRLGKRCSKKTGVKSASLHTTHPDLRPVYLTSGTMKSIGSQPSESRYERALCTAVEEHKMCNSTLASLPYGRSSLIIVVDHSRRSVIRISVVKSIKLLSAITPALTSQPRQIPTNSNIPNAH